MLLHSIKKEATGPTEFPTQVGTRAEELVGSVKMGAGNLL